MLHDKSPGEVVNTREVREYFLLIYGRTGKRSSFVNGGMSWSDGSDVSGVYLQRLDSSEPVKLGPGKALALSPDGKWALTLQPQDRNRTHLIANFAGPTEAVVESRNQGILLRVVFS